MYMYMLYMCMWPAQIYENNRFLSCGYVLTLKGNQWYYSTCWGFTYYIHNTHVVGCLLGEKMWNGNQTVYIYTTY